MTYNAFSHLCQNFARPIIAQLICLTLAMMVAYQLISGIKSIYEINTIQSTPIPIVSPVEHQNSQQALRLGLKKQFFGEYVPTSLNDGTVKQSMINLKVVGILYGHEAQDSQVILHTPGGQDRTFRIGDTLPGDVILKRITAQGVFIERKGVLESLSLPTTELIFEDQAKPLIEEKDDAN